MSVALWFCAKALEALHSCWPQLQPQAPPSHSSPAPQAPTGSTSYSPPYSQSSHWAKNPLFAQLLFPHYTLLLRTPARSRWCHVPSSPCRGAVFTLPCCVEHLLLWNRALPALFLAFYGGNPFHPLNSPILQTSKWGTEGREPFCSICSLASFLFQPLCKHPAPLRQAPQRVPCWVLIMDVDKPPGYVPSLKRSASGLLCSPHPVSWGLGQPSGRWHQRSMSSALVCQYSRGHFLQPRQSLASMATFSEHSVHN